MARLFVRLKLTLLGRGLRGRGLRVASFVAGGLFGLVIALDGFGLLAVAGHRADVRAAAPVVAFTLAFPIFGWGLDETLDPSRLALLPLRRRDLMGGLLAASAVGIAPAATLLALCGTLAGYATVAGAAVVAAAILVELGLCLVAARAVTTVLSRVMRSRRGRDAWAVVASLFGLLVVFLGQLPRLVGRTPNEGALARAAAIMRWLPPGMLGRAVVEAGRGRVLVPILELLPATGLAALFGWWWASSLERMLTTVERPAPLEAGSGTPGSVDELFGRLGRILPRDRRGAVAAKDLRYLRRDPMLRVQRVMVLLYGAAFVVFIVVTARRHDLPVLVLAAAALAWWLASGALGQFGSDRSAYWMNVVAAGDPADDLVGKNAAVALAVAPAFVVAAVVAAAVTGGWDYLPLATALAVAAVAVRLAPGNNVSVRLARPMPESRTNLWSGRTGQGCGTALVLFGVVLVDQLLLAPLAGLVLAGLFGWRPLLWVAVPVSVLYTAVLYRTGFRLAARWLRGHQAELLEALSPRRAP